MINIRKKLSPIFNGIKQKDGIDKINKCDILFFCHDVDRGTTLNNKAYSPLIDTVRDAAIRLNLKCITIAHPWSKLVYGLSHGETISINRRFLFAVILKKITRINFIYKLYLKIFDLSQPRLIITISCSDFFCQAAHDRKIFHIELLHGIGYSKIPWGWEQKEKYALPDCILSLDTVSTEVFKLLEKKDILIKQINHPFLNIFSANNIENIPKEWLPKKNKTGYKKEVLITIQWGYFKGIDLVNGFEGILEDKLIFDELLSVIEKTKNEIFWRLRLHPVQLRQPVKYRIIYDMLSDIIKKNKNCEWEESSRLPLPAILLTCDSHITMLSMSSYEAAYMGVPTLALCPTLQKNGIYSRFFEDLEKLGYLRKARPNKSLIYDWVLNTKKIHPLYSNKDTNDFNKVDDFIKWAIK